ncbi:MAG TPA: hypothetical protein VGR43_10880, partial [Dehalococcoidia bacterium]|nr:hypothetical protein [Dehalococcoidia bacterium]
DEKLIACLEDAYRLRILQVTFLPLGADPHTAVFRAVANQDRAQALRYLMSNFLPNNTIEIAHTSDKTHG